MKLGYIRVSSTDQNTARQDESLAPYQLDRVFTDKLSGKDVNRPQLELLQQLARAGDTIYCHSLDRLGRSLSDLLELVRKFTTNGVKVVFIKEGMSFTGDDSPISKFCLQIMGALAEMERAIIRDRQREGIAIAKDNGVYTGRKRSMPSIVECEIREKFASGLNHSLLAKEYGVSRGTIYNVLGRK